MKGWQDKTVQGGHSKTRKVYGQPDITLEQWEAGNKTLGLIYAVPGNGSIKFMTPNGPMEGIILLKIQL